MRWLMLLVLFVVRLSMGYLFQSVASTSSELVRAFGLSYAEVGSLIGLFLLPGLFISIPSGALTRRVADKNLLMVGALAMALGAAVMGSASGATALVAGRAITGVGGSLFNLLLTKMVTEWFLGLEITLALSIMLTAWPIGIALGLMTHGAIADAHGWPWVMYVTAIGALASLLLTAALYRAPPSKLAGAAGRLRFTLPRREFAQMSVVALGWTLYNAAIVGVAAFAPDALVAAGHPPEGARAYTSLTMWVMTLSLPLGGRLLQSAKRIGATIAVFLIPASAVTVAIAYGFHPTAAFIAFGVLIGIPGGALMSLSAVAVRPENRGPGLGVFYTWYFGGMTIAPGIAGWLRDQTGSAAAPILFFALAAAAVVLCIGGLRAMQSKWPIGASAPPAPGSS